MPVRIQWDPERDIHLDPLPMRSIQIGLGGVAVDRYVDEWTVSIRDVTGLARRTYGLIQGGAEDEATALLPLERPYPLAPGLATRLGTGRPAHDV